MLEVMKWTLLKIIIKGKYFPVLNFEQNILIHLNKSKNMGKKQTDTKVNRKTLFNILEDLLKVFEV